MDYYYDDRPVHGQVAIRDGRPIACACCGEVCVWHDGHDCIDVICPSGHDPYLEEAA